MDRTTVLDDIDDLVDGLITADQAGALAGVKPATIRQWASRGHLHVAARRHGQPLYSALDVAKVEHRIRKARPHLRAG